MDAQTYSAIFAGAGLLLTLATLFVALHTKAAATETKLMVTEQLEGLRREMREEYVTKELYNREHPVVGMHSARPQVSR